MDSASGTHLPLIIAVACFLGVYILKQFRKYVESRYGVPSSWDWEKKLFQEATGNVLYNVFIVLPVLFVFLVVYFYFWDQLVVWIFGP